MPVLHAADHGHSERAIPRRIERIKGDEMTSLKVFLWVYIACLAIGVLARCALLSWREYPRTSSYTRGEDVLAILFHAAFGVWAFTLLP